MKTGKYAVLAMIILLAALGFSACLGIGGGQTAGTGQEADTVIRMQCGLPQAIKGELP